MKRRRVKPIASRSSTKSVQSEERLPEFVEDPVPKKRDMKAEQENAFQEPEDLDTRTKSSERNQGRTR
jgi:hypothetical protein